MKILVIEHEADAGLRLLGERFDELGIETEVVGPEAGVPVPETLDGYAGLIVLGGTMGPTDDLEAPWLPATRKLLVDAVDSELPTLGICLGSQLLATALGGNVRKIPTGPEVGVYSIDLNESGREDPLLGGLGAELPTVQWHWLEADRLPEGAEPLASTQRCANQAFRVGSHAWGLQFHPEALTDAAERWASLDDLVPEGFDPDTVIQGVREAEPELRKTWRALADRFSSIAGAADLKQSA